MNLNKKLYLLLVAFTLLFLQAGSFAHGISHILSEQSQDQTQPQDKLCDLCATYAQTGNALGSSPITFAAHCSQYSDISIYSNRYKKTSFAAFAARAPPYSV
ncbi:MAG: hypothetical protein Q8O24_00235 [Gallionellaceae bacterium]|nr:hypothetical protein [Gallionellaceae bacterium]